MPRLPVAPENAVPLRLFSELHQQIRDFFDHPYNCVIIADPGLSKSWYAKQCAEKSKKYSYYAPAKFTPIQLYIHLYQNQHKATCLDDAEVIWSYKDGRKLMRQCTDSYGLNDVDWV